jgi:hypothetical protein
MIDTAARPLALIPSEAGVKAKAVGCPFCRQVLMLLINESGIGTTPLDVFAYDLAESTHPGFWNLKGGFIWASPHRCRRSRLAYARADRAARQHQWSNRSGEGG